MHPEPNVHAMRQRRVGGDGTGTEQSSQSGTRAVCATAVMHSPASCMLHGVQRHPNSTQKALCSQARTLTQRRHAGRVPVPERLVEGVRGPKHCEREVGGRL